MNNEKDLGGAKPGSNVHFARTGLVLCRKQIKREMKLDIKLVISQKRFNLTFIGGLPVFFF